MKKNIPKKSARTNAILTAVIGLAVGAGLLILSQLLHSVAKRAQEERDAKTAAAAPASAPASAPAPGAPAKSKPVDPRAAANDRMANLLLLFSLMGFGVAVVAVGWIVYDIRRSRPAWMTQTKYPLMEKKRKPSKK